MEIQPTKANIMGTPLRADMLCLRVDAELIANMLGLPANSIEDFGKSFAKEPEYLGEERRWWVIRDPKLPRPMVAAQMKRAMDGPGEFKWSDEDQAYFWVKANTNETPKPVVPVQQPLASDAVQELRDRVAKLEIILANAGLL